MVPSLISCTFSCIPCYITRAVFRQLLAVSPSGNSREKDVIRRRGRPILEQTRYWSLRSVINIMELCGKWKLVSADKVGEYCDAIGAAEAPKQQALKLLTAGNNIIQEIKIDGNKVTIVTTLPGKTIEVSGVLGETQDTNFLDGRPLKTVYTVDGNQLKEEQTGSFISSNVRYLEGGKLVYKMTSNGVCTSRIYEKV